MDRKSSWRTRTYYRITIAAMLCLTALALGAVSIFDTTAAADSATVQKESKSAGIDTVKASPAASAALDSLRRATGAQIKAHVSKETGHYDFVRAADGLVLEVDNTSASPEERAFNFLRARGALIGMNVEERKFAANKASIDTSKSVSVLKVARVDKDSVGGSHVRLNQFHKALPVFGAQVIVHMNDRGITAINGHYVPDIKILAKPSLSAAQAAKAALRVGDASLKVVKTELSIYRIGLLEGYSGNSVLAYAVEVTDGGALREQVWIDASKGSLLNRISLNHPALSRKVYAQAYDPLLVVRQEGDPLTPGPTPGTTGADPINNLYVMAGQTYDFYKSVFNRDSYDGLGHIMESVLLVSTNPNIPCPNAWWNGTTTNYCPELDADDVVTHEWTHAYTQFTHGLIYSYQSGALNESWSDIFGESIDLTNNVDAEGGNNNEDPAPTGQRWVIGEDVVSIGPIRDMWDPTSFGDADKVSSGNYACGSGDGGGVHSNSGIPNHAFAILVDGKHFNGVNVHGIGLTRALHIYFRAMTLYQTPTTNFAAHAQAVQTSCNDLIGQSFNAISPESGSVSISDQTCQQVANAMAAVEMSAAPPCNFVPILNPDTPELCAGAADIFVEDWESGDDGWTRTSEGVFPDWEDNTRDIRDFAIRSGLPKDRAGSAAYATNPALGERGGGSCTPGGQPEGDYSGEFSIDSPQITIPTDAENLGLRFDHYVASEATFDGGQVEVSVNDGEFQLVPQANYEFNKPNSAFAGAPPVGNNTNPNAGEFAWHGTDTGSQEGSWGTTLADLSGLAGPGDTVKLRFKFSQDGCNGVDGWYVDNIHLYSCPNLEAPQLTLGADYQEPDPNGAYTLTWTRPDGAIGPDVLQETSVCGPVLSENAESGLGQWTVAGGASSDEGQLVFPMWQSAPAGQKPNHSSTSFWANPVSEQETQNTFTTLTYNNPIQIPSVGITTMRFSEWYFNEDDDKGLVEVSTDNGATWTAIYTNNRPMGDLPDLGVEAFANEGLSAQQLDLTIYSGQTIRLRFRYSLGVSNFVAFFQYGWYIDDISITNDGWVNLTNADVTSFLVSGRSSGTRCYRVRTTYPGGIPSPYSNLAQATVFLTVSPPSVSIASPAEGATFASGSDITIMANAGDSDGTVSTVEFYEGANKIGEDTTGPSPFSFTWNDVAAGSYTLSAKATDNDGATTTSDPVHITVSEVQAAEYIEDNDSRISYANGWHLINDPDASAGHFRMNTGKDANHVAGLTFTASGSGKITYYFARSTKGGTAEVALLNSNNTQLEARAVNYKGTVGSSKDPEFNENIYKEEFVVPAAGQYTLSFRNTNGAVYIDRFKLESATSTAQPATGPGETSSNVNSVGVGKQLFQSITLPAGAQAISVVAEASPELPIQLLLIDPSGTVLNTANNSTGFAVINRNVTQPGVYVIKVVNVSLGPVQVWTLATPLVQR